jgi:Nucleotidyl transferase AbiEii toxin, Type IV TA system
LERRILSAVRAGEKHLGRKGGGGLNRRMMFLNTIAQKAAAAELRYLLVGGNAVIAHGFPRQTRDIDLLVRSEDRRAWDTLILGLGYMQHQVAQHFHMYNPIDRSLPPVDLIVVDEATFSKMESKSQENKIHGADVRLPTLSHLIAMKLHALRSDAPHRRTRDLLDVLELVRINGVDLAQPEYQELIDRYADARTREELSRHIPGFGSRLPDA